MSNAQLFSMKDVEELAHSINLYDDMLECCTEKESALVPIPCPTIGYRSCLPPVCLSADDKQEIIAGFRTWVADIRKRCMKLLALGIPVCAENDDVDIDAEEDLCMGSDHPVESN